MTSPADTRSQIMDAFSDQLAATGYPGISLAGVARTVGIQKPSIYHHFPGGKEELYIAITVRFIDALRNRITAALATSGSTADRLRALAEVSAGHSAGAVSFEQRIFDTLALVAEETRTDLSQRYVSGVLEPVFALFTAAVEEGEVSGDPEFLANAFLHLARASDLAQSPDVADRIVALFLDGARPR